MNAALPSCHAIMFFEPKMVYRAIMEEVPENGEPAELGKAEIADKVQEKLELVHVPDAGAKFPTELSGALEAYRTFPGRLAGATADLGDDARGEVPRSRRARRRRRLRPSPRPAFPPTPTCWRPPTTAT